MEKREATYHVDPSDGECRTLWVNVRGKAGVGDLLAVLDDVDEWTDKQIALMAYEMAGSYFEGTADRDWDLTEEITEAVTDALNKVRDDFEQVVSDEFTIVRKDRE